MTLTLYLSGLYEDNIGMELMERLREAYPQGRVRHYFEATLPLIDSRARELLTILDDAGWHPWINRLRERERDHEYTFRLHREYTSAELSGFEYLRLKAPDYLFERDIQGREVHDHGGAWREAGVIELEPRFLRRDIDFGSARIFGQWPVVPDRVRRLLETGQLRRVLFKPTALVGRRRALKLRLDWRDEGEPWWELASDLRLPPAEGWAAPEQFEREVRLEDILRGEGLPEHVYGQPEFHYRREALRPLGTFDLAHTFEATGGKPGPAEDSALIASQRFRQVCLEHQLRAEWVPVHVEN